MRPEIKRARIQKSRSPDLPGPSSRVDSVFRTTLQGLALIAFFLRGITIIIYVLSYADFFFLLTGFMVSSNKVLQGKHGSIPESIAT